MNPATHGVWFTEQAGVAGTAFHMALGIWLSGPLDKRALDDACTAVITRHPSLSCAVAVDGDLPRFVPAAEKVTLAEAVYTEDRVREEIARPYDLSRGPLARLVLMADTPSRHLFLFTAHHLVFDGMSKDILARDLAAAYSNSFDGSKAVGQEPGERTPDVAAARQYWATHWTPPGEVNLPGLKRVPIAAEPGQTVEFALTTPAQFDGLTRFEVLLAGIHVLLARYGNSGTPVCIGLSTRTSATSDQIGLFVNELPIVVAPAHGTFREYAHDLRQRLRELYAHRDVPLSHAVGGIRPAAALTPISVGYRKRGGDPDFPGISTQVEWTLFGGAARNALHFQIVDGPDGLAVSLQHSPEALPADAVRRIAEHLKTVLAADPDADLATIPIMPRTELDTVLTGWNATERRFSAQVLALIAQQRPDAVAIVDGGTSLTYAELDKASTDLAGKIPKCALVAICMPRGWQAVVAMLATMRSGATYVPVDPAYPEHRRRLILADADPDLLISGRGAIETRQSTTDRPANAAYVMYTSGSTGTPKGVVVPHTALANLLLAMAETIGSKPGDRWLGLTPLSFDISGLELFLPLITGGSVVIASETSSLDGRALAALIRDDKVTHVQATPSGWRVLLDSGAGLPPDLTALAGGEALPLDLARQLRSKTSRLINVYGPTETTIWSTADEIPPDPQAVTIGRPIANTRAYILDPEGRPLPIGIWGELCLGGDGVADGYLRRPELTAQRFVPNPFGPGRLYRTGDRCRWTSDGRILFGGRDDGQVKIRGHRIELEEIETRLREHPDVAHAAVKVHGEQLAAYIVARDRVADPAALRVHVAQTLPAAMVPSLWSVLDRLPVSPAGKLDRAALPEPAPMRSASNVDDEEDGTIATIREIWQEVLAIDDIGVDEDLFDLGGHSLTITRISGRIHQRLGVEVPLEVFFDTPTIGEIAQYLKEQP